MVVIIYGGKREHGFGYLGGESLKKTIFEQDGGIFFCINMKKLAGNGDIATVNEGYLDQRNRFQASIL
jgi:hypothetical protein